MTDCPPSRRRPRTPRLAASLAVLLTVLLPGAASADFAWEFYDGTFSELADVPFGSPDSTGTSSTIDLLGQTDTFALVFTNTVTIPTSGDYEFFTNSDDGSRIYIDGNLVVDNDGLHAPVTVANVVTLNAGTYPLRVEFFERTGGQVLDVGYRTGNPSYEPIPADGVLSYTSQNESEFGSWGAVIQWPEIAISAANLPDGRVLTWSSTETNAFPSGPTFTHASVFDPSDESFVSVDSNFHDMFCAGISSLEDGTIVAAGGNPSDRRTSAFDPATLSWSALSDMIDLRWYGTNVTLPNNTIWATFAKDAGNRSEVYDPATDTWTATPNANMQVLVDEQNAINNAPDPTGALNHEWWAHMAVTPVGDVFQGGPTQTWHRFDPIGGAANVSLGQPIGDLGRMYGNAVTYDAGKVLLVGGADSRQDPPTSVNNVYLVDLNGPSPTVTAGAPMNYPRALCNTVTLPNGQVLVVGGNEVARIFTDEASVLPAEIYDPAADTWTVVDSITIPRNYHSTALLLKDGRVLSAGGGACGNCSANHLDGQIYSPPYLFESDDTPATRPTLAVTPGQQLSAGDDLVVTASSDVTGFSVVRLSGTTHHLNTDQRFLPLSSVDNGDGTFTVSFPANPNVLIVGNYWLFALDADGTPSIGETIQVVRSNDPPPDLPGYRFYRFEPTVLRNDPGANSVQLAELSLFFQGQRQHAANVSNPGGSNPAGEEPFRADDADTATKWLDFNRGALVYDFANQVEIDAYSITTANDVPDRDPVRWLLEGSDDGVTWELLDDQTAADFPTPLARLTEITPIPLVILSPITALPEPPRHSSTLIVETSSGSDRIWNVNPDNDTVSVTDPAGTLLMEIPVGDQPWSLAKQPGANLVFVTNKGDATISVIDSLGFGTVRTALLPRASQPHGIVFSGDGVHYFVVLEAAGAVEKRLASDDSLVTALPLAGRPQQVSMKYDDTRLYVSNFVTPPIPGESTTVVDIANGAGEVFPIDPATMTLDPTIELPHDDRPHSESQGPGMPNYLGPLVVSFDEQWGYLPSKKDHVSSGTLRGIFGMTFDATVRAHTSRVVLSTELEDPAFRVDHDNSSVATGAALTGDDRYLLVTLETSRELAVYDTVNGFQLMRLPTGRAPQSVALSSDGSLAYVHDYLDRAVSRYDLTEMLQTHLPATNLLPAVSVVASEALTPSVLLGKQHFYDAADDRIALNNYISCASCHKDGRDDGRSWDLGFAGEGIRKTISLRGRGDGHGPSHWTGNFDEIHDFENQIRQLNLGTGFLTTQQFTDTGHPLGPPKAGLSADLDALADYVESLVEVHESPHRPGAGILSAAAEAGRQAFALEGCLSCHALPWLTDSALDVRHDVGTIDVASGQRLNGPLDGFDTPGLLSAWASPPYLHDGAAQTLEDAITSHSAFAGLPAGTVADIATFLREAEPGDLAGLEDSDGDGPVDVNDPAPLDPCVPAVFVPVCLQDTDGDGTSDHDEGEFTDTDGDGAPDWQESSIADADLDTTTDQFDVADADACIPQVFVGACLQDTDGDGTPDSAEGEFTDTDGDGAPDWQESSIADADLDTTTDQFDVADADACIPQVFVGACLQDTDGDGTPDSVEGEFTDTDGDGAPDWQESSVADADGDTTADQFDIANADACVPEVFVAACGQDSDGDGTPDFVEGEFADGDGDGLYDWEESSLADADADTTADQFDVANADACVPEVFVAACGQDTDGDGTSDHDEGEFADTDGDGLYDWEESSLADSDGDTTADQFDIANADACVPEVFVAACGQDTDGDGTSDHDEGEFVDTDGDGLLDWVESSILDYDSDTLADQFDEANGNGCIPDPMFCPSRVPALGPADQVVLMLALFALGWAILPGRSRR